MLLMFHVSLGGPTTDTCCQNFGSLNLLAVGVCHLFKIGSFVGGDAYDASLSCAAGKIQRLGAACNS